MEDSTGASSLQAAITPLHLPPYSQADPQLWFAQVELQFAGRNITTQLARFRYVVAHLPPEAAAEVRDLIISPHPETPYDTLKKELVRRTTTSERARLQQLFLTEELGDRRPTQLLRRMRQLVGNSTSNETFLRELFLQRLPTNACMILQLQRRPIWTNSLKWQTAFLTKRHQHPLLPSPTFLAHHTPPPPKTLLWPPLLPLSSSYKAWYATWQDKLRHCPLLRTSPARTGLHDYVAAVRRPVTVSVHHLRPALPIAGTIVLLAMPHAIASSPVPGRETPPPTTSGWSGWGNKQPALLHHRPVLWLPLPC